MKEFLQTIFRSTEDRIKNPFIGTFITSWIVFNWKPILYLIFSDENIRDRITYISTCYSDIWCYLWLPLISAVLYNSFLPYLNLLFEYLVSFSIKRRNNVSLQAREASLEMQIQVEKNAITLEEEKTTFRERKSHNAMVESLQEQVNILNRRLEDSNQIYTNLATKSTEEKDEHSKTLNQLKEEYQNKITKLNEDLTLEKVKNREITSESTVEKNLLTKYEFTIHDLNDALELEKFKFERFKNRENKILAVGELVLLEFFLSDTIIYWEVHKNTLYDIKFIASLSKHTRLVNNNNDRTTIAYFESQLLTKYPDPNQIITEYPT